MKRLTAQEQEHRIVTLWMERPRDRRTADDVLTFYGWLSEHEPALIPKGVGSYQQLRALLSKYFA